MARESNYNQRSSPQDYYGYGEDSPSTPNQRAPEDKDEGEEPTALIPKSLLAGKKFEVGDEVCLEIVAQHEEEVEVKYSTKTPPEESTTPEEPMEKSPPGSMGAYMD